MNKWHKHLPLLWLLLIPSIGVLYALQNHARPDVHVLSTQLDRETPFIPFFSIFYMVWYPFLFSSLYLMLRKKRSAYYQTLVAVCIGILAADVVFYFYPTYVPRPQLANGWNFLVPITYRFDEPYNGFPSIHVLTCYLMLRGSRVLAGSARWYVAVTACFIILSTLFIKQHVIADALAGMALGEIVFRISGRLVRERRKAVAREAASTASL